MLELQWPWLLWLAPLPLLMLLLPAQKREEAALRVPFFNAAKEIESHGHGRARKKLLPFFLLWLIWLSTLLAAANPQWIGEPVSIPSSGRDLMLAVDISDSMDTTDIVYNGRYINRLNGVKLVVGNFVEHRLNDRLGLILFGSNAYIQAPLTYDRNTVGTLLWEAQLRFAGPTTAIGDAIGLAAKRLRDQEQQNRVLILLTDGANTAGEISPLNGADLAAKLNIKVYTIGFGRNDREIDEETLISVAEKTGGRYFRARNLEQLAEIHSELNRLEPVEQDAQSFRPVRALFYWPLAVALILSLLFAAVHWLRHRTGGNSTAAIARAEVN